MKAPTAKQTNDEMAAVHGLGCSSGSTPSSSRACRRSASSGLACTARATSWARSGAQAAGDPRLGQLGDLLVGVAFQLAALLGQLGRDLLALRAHRGVLAQGHRDRPGDQARGPVSSTVRAATPAPPTPAMSAMFETSPSIAPNTAARSHPPDTSA